MTNSIWNVPRGLEPLIPFAEKWGISDDARRVDQVERAANNELHELVACLDLVEERILWNWLEDPVSANKTPTREYVAFTCLTMAIETAQIVLEERNRHER